MFSILSPSEKLFLIGCLIVGLLFGIGFPDKVTIQTCCSGLGIGLFTGGFIVASFKFLEG